MPTILRLLGERFPGLEVQSNCSRSSDLLAAQVAAGELDLAFGVVPLPRGPMSFQPLLEDPYVLVVPTNWPIASRETAVGVDEVRDLSLIANEDPRVEEALLLELRKRGSTPNYVARAEGDGAVQALVAAELGAAFLPRMAVDYRDEQITALDLADLIAPQQIVLYWSTGADKTPAIDAFTEVASRACGGGLKQVLAAPLGQKAA
jgi:DNA-binding transcriptional LysR family regulator